MASFLQEEHERRERENDPLVEQFWGENGGVLLCEKTLVFKSGDYVQRVPLSPSISASVLDGAQAKRASTAKIVMLGVAAFGASKKNQGTRFLIIESPEFCWSIEALENKASDAVSMSVRINNACRQARHTVLQERANPSHREPRNQVTGAVGENLQMLVSLKNNNVITAEEFEIFKSRIMGH